MRGIAPTLEEQVADAYAKRQQADAFAANLDAEAEAAHQEQARAEVRKEVEDLARARLAEWISAGGSEHDFKTKVWPQILDQHLAGRRVEQTAERRALLESARDQIF